MTMAGFERSERKAVAQVNQTVAPVIQRCGGITCAPGTCDHDDDIGVARSLDETRSHAFGSVAPPSVHATLGQSGRPLSGSVRTFMEARFGYDFGRVRVHDDAQAASSAEAVRARAYTVGSHIVFAARAYDPDTESGRRLIAHELVHTVQQAARNPLPDKGQRASSSAVPANETATSTGEAVAGLRVGDPGDVFEREADRIADLAMGVPVLDRRQVGTLHRADAAPRLQMQSAPVQQRHDWYMLRPPPVVKQQSLTCWAAALASLQQVLGTSKVKVDDIVMRYAGSSCILPDNSLPLSSMDEVYGEWGVKFIDVSKPQYFTFDKIRDWLERHGWLILARIHNPLGHALVIYGVGFDQSGAPSKDHMSVMDPILGGYQNIPISGERFPLRIGFATGKLVRPASCVREPGADPGSAAD